MGNDLKKGDVVPPSEYGRLAAGMVVRDLNFKSIWDVEEDKGGTLRLSLKKSDGRGPFMDLDPESTFVPLEVVEEPEKIGGAE